MRIEETFIVACPPEAVFDYMTEPANLREWQTTKTRVEPLTEGRPRLGYRVREWTKPPGGKEFVQVVEFTRFEPPSCLQAHVIDGPYPVDGTWTLSPTGDAGTQVHFVAEGPLPGLMRLAEPIAARLIGRQFAGHHERLRRHLESRSA